ncbi:MAG TPA: leucine-rich repeat domain-containing protein, partial [Bacteroidia bacterium]|nr:leucine-rich repeat domain-containing protein [Bacteroidia bacterium]
MKDYQLWQSARIHRRRRKTNPKKLYFLGVIIICILLYLFFKILPTPTVDKPHNDKRATASSEIPDKSVSERHVTALPSPTPTPVLSKVEMICDGKGMYDNLDEAVQSPEDVCLLNLSRSYLSGFPEEILTFTNLKVLFLSDNGFTHIPGNINTLTKLEILQLGGNQFTAIPPEIGDLVNLTELSFGPAGHRQNYIARVPSEIGNLTNLTVLNLAY